jgi:hypothetical protein
VDVEEDGGTPSKPVGAAGLRQMRIGDGPSGSEGFETDGEDLRWYWAHGARPNSDLFESIG